MPICTSCQADLPADSRFCPRCGAVVHAPAGATVGATATETSPLPTPTPWHGRFEPGTRLGTRYRIVGLLGKGGMGEVYRADDLELNQPVALKFLPTRIHAGGPELDRLRQEVRIARGISHPNVCRTYDISAQDSQVFVVMEYIDGEDLASVLRRLGRPSRDKGVEIARQICLGLGAAHEGGIIHRDLKPANIMIDGRGRVRITDFGLAGVADELSSDGTVSGTPAYMAPEQLAGGAASVQSDLYSLGLVLYELFTGKRAFDSRDPAEIRRLQTDSSVRSPSSLTPDIEPAVNRAIMRCLERDPRERPGSAYAVLGALPGGDPLAAALAAGETPSPELVANAQVAGGLKPAVALACIAFILLTFGWWAGAQQRLPRGFTRSNTFLSLRAEDVLAKAGIANPPRYAYGGFDQNLVYNSVRARMDSIAAARGRPKPGGEAASLYWRRFSPDPLVSSDLHDPIPRLFKPPQALPGSAMVLMAPDGRLILLEVVPDTGKPGTTDSPNAGDRVGDAAADWPALVSAAGYDATRMSRVTPSASPAVRTDSVTAWSVPGRRSDDPPVTLLAGWLGGKVVHVSIDSEWGTSVDPFAFRSPPSGDDAFGWVRLLFWSLIPMVAGVFFGVRNLRAGRGDRRGATVLAAFVFACYWIAHFIVQDVPRTGVLGTLDSMLDQIPIGHALMHAVSVWFVYVALEPYLRRLWPRVLVSWARLVTGHYRDPLIGRDIVIGFVYAGADAGLTLAAKHFGPTQNTGPPVQIFDSLAGTGLVLGSVLYDAAISVLIALGFFSVLLLARLTLRRNDLAVAAAILVIGLATYFGFASDLGPLAGGAATLGSVGLCLVGIRFGLFAGFVGAFVRPALDMIPWTTDLSVWYSGRMILVLAVLAALLIYGVANALAGRSIFKDPIQEGARAG